MAGAYDEDDSEAEAWGDYESRPEERPRNRLAEALMVFGLTFPFAVLLVTGLAILGIGLVIAVVYAMMWSLITALASGPDG